MEDIIGVIGVLLLIGVAILLLIKNENLRQLIISEKIRIASKDKLVKNQRSIIESLKKKNKQLELINSTVSQLKKDLSDVIKNASDANKILHQKIQLLEKQKADLIVERTKLTNTIKDLKKDLSLIESELKETKK